MDKYFIPAISEAGNTKHAITRKPLGDYIVAKNISLGDIYRLPLTLIFGLKKLQL